MARLRPNPEYLQNRFNILDMLAVVFIPALIASLWPVEDREQRLSVFFPALALAGASGWWTSTLIHTFKIKGAWKRLGIHVYAFLSFAAFLTLVLGSIIAFILAFDHKQRGSLGITLGLIALCAIPTVSILYLERIRQRVEKSFIDEAHGAPPIDAAAKAAQDNLKQLRDAKEKS